MSQSCEQSKGVERGQWREKRKTLEDPGIARIEDSIFLENGKRNKGESIVAATVASLGQTCWLVGRS